MMRKRMLLLALGLTLTGCAAIYPELGTRLEPAPASARLEPPPPEGLRYVAIEAAEIPARTRDGRPWGRSEGSKPNPYAVLYVNEVEILRTVPERDTLTASFEKSKRGNFPVRAGDKIRVELWNDSPLTNQPIGMRSMRLTPEILADGAWRASFDGGGSVRVRLEPAKAMFGLGLWYELGQRSITITRRLDNSPASRAGIEEGDRVVVINGRGVSSMSRDEVRSLFNAPPPEGLSMTLERVSQQTYVTTVKEGPIYPTFSQYGQLR